MKNKTEKNWYDLKVNFLSRIIYSAKLNWYAPLVKVLDLWHIERGLPSNFGTFGDGPDAVKIDIKTDSIPSSVLAVCVKYDLKIFVGANGVEIWGICGEMKTRPIELVKADDCHKTEVPG